MAHSRDVSEFEYLRARATMARILVRRGTLDPADALALAVWPTEETTTRERRVKRSTIASRASSRRLNA